MRGRWPVPAAELQHLGDDEGAVWGGVLQRLLLSLRDGTPTDAVRERVRPRPPALRGI